MSVVTHPSVTVGYSLSGDVDCVSVSLTWRIALRSAAQLLPVDVLRSLAASATAPVSASAFSDVGVLPSSQRFRLGLPAGSSGG